MASASTGFIRLSYSSSAAARSSWIVHRSSSSSSCTVLPPRKLPLLLSFLAILVSLLLQYCSTTDAQTRPTVLSVNTTVKGIGHEDLSFLGSTIQFATFEAFTDQDLYLTEGVPCRATCYKPILLEEACDFTRHGSRCGEGNPGACSSLRERYCDTSFRWKTLEEGKATKPKVISQSNPAFYRLFNSRRCVAIKINFEIFAGQAAYFVSWAPEAPSYQFYVSYNVKTTAYNSPMFLCPSANVQFPYGTLTIGVYSTSPQANYSIGYEVIDLEKKTNPPEPVKPNGSNGCQPVSSQHTCLTADAYNPIYLTTPNREIYFQYTFDGCQELHIWTELVEASEEVFGTDSTILETWTLGYSLDSQKPSTLASVRAKPVKTFTMGTDSFIEVCPPKGKTKGNLYFSFWATFVANFTLMVETDKKSWNRVPITQLYSNPFDYHSRLAGTAALQCRNTNLYCEPIRTSSVFNCFTFFPYVTDPFAIPPAVMDQLSSLSGLEIVFQQQGDPVFDVEPHPRRIPHALILTYGFPLLNSSLLQDCRLRMGLLSPLSNKDGRRVVGSFPLTKVFPECSEQLRAINAAQSQLLQDLVSSTSIQEAATAVYQVDRLRQMDAYLGCRTSVNSLMTESDISTTLNQTDECILEPEDPHYAQDPCCDPFTTKSWKSDCCLPRDLPYEYRKFTAFPLDQEFEEACSDARCAQLYLQDYTFLRQFSDNAGYCDPRLDEDFTSITDSLGRAIQCRYQSFGPDFRGIPCREDRDCPSENCDFVSGRCVYDSAADDLYWKCLLDNVVDDTLALDLYGPGVSRREAIRRLRSETSTGSCFGPYGVAVSGVGHFQRKSLEASCPIVGNLYCLDTNCPVPLRYSSQLPGGRLNSVCAYEWLWTVPFDPDCNTLKVCLGDPSAQNRAQCEDAGISFCGYCGEAECYTDPAIQDPEVCERAYACFGADGTVTTTSSAEECEARFTCDSLCNGLPCNSREACEGVGGICSGRGAFATIQGITQSPSLPQQICVQPLEPWNFPDCSSAYSTNSTPFGIGCVSPISDDLRCPKGDIYTLPLTKESCKEYGKGCQEGFELFSPKSEDVCKACGKQTAQKQRWTKGKWRRSVAKPMAWRKNEWKRITQQQDWIDFPRLGQLLERGLTLRIATSIQSAYFCESSASFSFVAAIACLCESTEDTTLCYQLRNAPVGATRVCPGQEIVLEAYPGLIYFTKKEYTGNTCAVVTVQLVPQSTFLNTPKTQVANTFLNTPRDGTTSEAVRNNHNTIVGEIVSSGIRLKVENGSLSNFKELLVCVVLDGVVQFPNRYPVPDFATKRTGSSVVPLGTKAVSVPDSHIFDDGIYCAVIENPGDVLVEGYIIPINRVKDWQSPNYKSLTAGERAALLTSAILYLIGFVFGVLTLLFAIHQTGFKLRHDTTLILKTVAFILTITMLIRFIYFILSGSSAVYFGDIPIAEYILVELPDILFAIAFFLISLTFLYTALIIRTNGSSASLWKVVWLPFAVISFCLLAFFGIMIGVFHHLDENSVDLDKCGPLVVSASRNNHLNIFRIIYRSVLTAFVVCTSIFLFSLGLYIRRAVDKRRLHQPLKMLLLMAIVGFCLLASGIGFLVYYATFDSTPYFAWFAVATEVTAVVAVFWHMAGSQMLSKAHLSRSSSKRTSSSSPPGSSGSG